MASLLIRNVDDALHARLKARAAAHRRSLEEEARELLRTAVAREEIPARETLADLARRLFGHVNGADVDVPPRGSASKREPADFSDSSYNPPDAS
ncbi:FitA-like ribbon-helix-helix domain-containing protein [Beijerinckia indica]|uniref:Plasmid stability protein n=1 Tax=Beijerinckia indica subsp. indica (strain ATCC 9039 / DSM 1715 / NCIMB 8712) TaxID=395963 RepID=B2IJZ0_BEII9|nr:plasmid stability protein [Beijerinckia indica]ACB96365.1 plasmid stability protein [Beijerinckia indica subsp. indica ATCC 9039]